MRLLKTPAITLPACLISLFIVVAAARTAPDKASKDKITPANLPVASTKVSHTNSEDATALFSDLHLSEAGMAQRVFNSAIVGLHKLDSCGNLNRDNIITIIDFSQPSNNKRLYVIDLGNKEVLFNTLVAHGRNSGKLWARSFSNNPSSLKSSPGFYVTGDAYFGENGYSLRLNGMEKNINDNALSRAIVIHGAPYVDQSAISSLGYLGRSWGCPAIPLSSHEAIINTIKDGTCLFIYSPNKKYLQRSPILNS